MDDAYTTLAGRYRLVEVIGRGGMGTVYRAVDLVLGRTVAVKVLPGLLADQDPTSVARFEREARTVAALNHPAVVAVYDTGADATSRFIVMEFVEGRSLEEILRDKGRLDPERAARVVARVADALADAHAAAIVHRDIKPANVMVAEDGSVKVLDFGIARAIDATTLTQNAAVIGTAAYMAPEQALGKPADERSDIYSLGCVLYALITGHPPFSGDVAAAVLHQQAHIAPDRLRSHDSRVSPALDGLVMEMLEKSPADRPQTAAQVRDRLTTLSSHPPSAPVSTDPTARLPQITTTLPLPPAAPPGRGRLAGRRLAGRRLILVGGLAAAALVIVLVATTPGGSSDQSTTGRHHGATASKKRPHVTTPTTTAAVSTTQVTSTRTTAPSKAPKPRTVSATAGALTALTTQDVQSGTIDQQAAQQIGNGLTNVLNAYETGNTMNVQHQLATLSQQVAMLEQQGHVTPGAAPALTSAVQNLSTALASTPSPTTQITNGGPPAQPPGHGGVPPGQAKRANPQGG